MISESYWPKTKVNLKMLYSHVTLSTWVSGSLYQRSDKTLFIDCVVAKFSHTGEGIFLNCLKHLVLFLHMLAQFFIAFIPILKMVYRFYYVDLWSVLLLWIFLPIVFDNWAVCWNKLCLLMHLFREKKIVHMKKSLFKNYENILSDSCQRSAIHTAVLNQIRDLFWWEADMKI
jgi:hypothetical protein